MWPLCSALYFTQVCQCFSITSCHQPDRGSANVYSAAGSGIWKHVIVTPLRCITLLWGTLSLNHSTQIFFFMEVNKEFLFVFSHFLICMLNLLVCQKTTNKKLISGTWNLLVPGTQATDFPLWSGVQFSATVATLHLYNYMKKFRHLWLPKNCIFLSEKVNPTNYFKK